MRQSITIDRLGHQGDGIAAGPIFAARTLPGEVVSGVLAGDRLTDIRVETPSPDRVAAACAHYRACGGCQLMHASDGFVAGWKREVVAAALAAQGLEAEIAPVVTSPANARRRAVLAARRTRKGALAGFHARASDTITAIPGCRLLDRALLAAIPAVEEMAALGASRKGELAVTATVSAAGPDLAATGGKPLDGPLRAALGQLAARRGLARLAWDGDVVAMADPPAQRLGPAQVVPPPGAFLQATPQGEAALVQAVQEIVAGAARVIDLFAGCGTFTLPLATGAEVHAVEGATEMLAALDAGWRRAPGLKRITTEARDLFRRPLLPDELRHGDAVVLDPPRAGAEAQIAELARARVQIIAYVSCNPVSFARDARQLVQAGYRLGQVRVIDQFRWSAHVELAAALTLPQ